MSSEIFINSNQREIRVALMESNLLAELFIEHKSHKGIVGNIYKGKVTKILPGMQVAFVDIGLDKAGFLYVGDIDVIDMVGLEGPLEPPTPLVEEDKDHPFEGKPGRPNHDVKVQEPASYQTDSGMESSVTSIAPLPGTLTSVGISTFTGLKYALNC